MEEVVLKKERKLWIDALRGVAMILVVYGHCVKGWTEYYVFDGGIKMPLFFIISAYLFNPRSGNQLFFFKNLFWKLLFPWMVLGLFPYTHLLDRFLSLVEGKIFWFMPCLIISEILWFYIHKFCKTSTQIIVAGLLITSIGFLMNHYQVLHYARIDNAFVVQAFFVLGYVIREYEETLSHYWLMTVPCSLVTYIVLGVGILYFWPEEIIDVGLNQYPNVAYVSVMIVIGCMGLFVLFRKANIHPSWLVYIGQNTLFIYIMHYQGRNVFNLIASQVPQLQALPMQLFGFIQAVFALCLCCILVFPINQYVPIIVGKRKLIVGKRIEKCNNSM